MRRLTVFLILIVCLFCNRSGFADTLIGIYQGENGRRALLSFNNSFLNVCTDDGIGAFEYSTSNQNNKLYINQQQGPLMGYVIISSDLKNAMIYSAPKGVSYTYKFVGTTTAGSGLNSYGGNNNVNYGGANNYSGRSAAQIQYQIQQVQRSLDDCIRNQNNASNSGSHVAAAGYNPIIVKYRSMLNDLNQELIRATH